MDVRGHLRAELTARGHKVASDTLSLRRELYVMGPNDLAAALFEFKSSVREAIDTMYQGSWVEGLPPRFAVMPEEAADDPEFELLEQMRVVPLLYAVASERVEFLELERLLDEHVKEYGPQRTILAALAPQTSDAPEQDAKPHQEDSHADRPRPVER